MLYDYECLKCNSVIEINRSMKDSSVEICHSCGSVMSRIVTGGAGPLIKKTSWPEYNHGLGIVTKSSFHRQELAKAKGLIEIGSDNFSKTGDKMVKEKTDKHEKEWSNI